MTTRATILDAIGCIRTTERTPFTPAISYKMFIWLLEFVLLFISEQHAATAEKLVKQLHCKHFRKLFQIRPGSPKTCKGGGRIFVGLPIASRKVSKNWRGLMLHNLIIHSSARYISPFWTSPKWNLLPRWELIATMGRFYRMTVCTAQYQWWSGVHPSVCLSHSCTLWKQLKSHQTFFGLVAPSF